MNPLFVLSLFACVSLGVGAQVQDTSDTECMLQELEEDFDVARQRFSEWYSGTSCGRPITRHPRVEREMLENCRGGACVCNELDLCSHMSLDLIDELRKVDDGSDESTSDDFTGVRIARRFINVRQQAYGRPGGREAFGNALLETALPAYHLAVRDRRRRSAGVIVDNQYPLNATDLRAFQCVYDDMDGPNWAVCSRARDDPCGCSNVICETQGEHRRIVGLVLRHAGLKNALSDCVSDLSELRVLDISYNREVTSGTPDGFARLSKLETLAMKPSLGLAEAISQLSRLRLLELSFANERQSFETLTPLCRLTHLQALLLFSSFVGPLPSCFGALSSLVRLEVVGNYMMNTGIPPEWGNLVNLRVFVGFQSGAVWCPADRASLPPLECRPLYQAALEYSTDSPPWLCREFSLSGPIPDELRHWRKLEKFWVDANYLSGPIPEWIGIGWPNLRTLDLFNNVLTGEIPESMGQLLLLEQAQLQDNQLSGKVPPSLAKLPRLDFLNIALNANLTGCVRPNAYPLYRTMYSGTNVSDCM